MAEKTHWEASLVDRIIALGFRGLLGFLRFLPWKWQNRLTGWVARRIVANVKSLRMRVQNNLLLIYPELGPDERQVLQQKIATNIGRTIFEDLRSAEFLKRAEDIAPKGPGFDQIKAAQSEGRPVIITSGHFGNWQAVRAVLKTQGLESGGVYRPQNNRLLDDIYVDRWAEIGSPLISKGRSGMRQLVQLMRAGGIVSILIDQKVTGSPILDFLGKPALCPTTAADLALKHNALLVPAYGLRGEDPVSISVEFEASIPHSDAVSMTQALNDSLSARIRANPSQWFWFHQRWKI